ncbi:MAG: hypothetical protein V9E98_01015 [Candidatus Nanopelagicales bacterium]
MTKVDRRISMEQSVWEQLDSEASRTGGSTDELLEAAVRRVLARRRLTRILDAAADNAVTEAEAAFIARDELHAYRRAL